jgi:hypothetical protein
VSVFELEVFFEMVVNCQKKDLDDKLANQEEVEVFNEKKVVANDTTGNCHFGGNLVWLRKNLGVNNNQTNAEVALVIFQTKEDGHYLHERIEDGVVLLREDWFFKLVVDNEL